MLSFIQEEKNLKHRDALLALTGSSVKKNYMTTQ